MKVTIYIDWTNKKVYTQKEIEEMIAEEANKTISDEDKFFDWLENCFSAREIFNFTQERKKQVFDKWSKECQEWAEDRVEGRLSKQVLDI